MGGLAVCTMPLEVGREPFPEAEPELVSAAAASSTRRAASSGVRHDMDPVSMTPAS
jgi:hypothetical protein